MTIDNAGIRKLAFALLTGLLFARLSHPAYGRRAPRSKAASTRGSARSQVETGKKIEVIEFFSYGCPHCAEFEPFLEDWVKTQSADVAFRRVPVMFQPRWVELAKVFYTLEAMGEDWKLSPEVFSALHAKGLALWEPAKFYDWAATKGLDRKKVEDVYNSFAMSGRINRAKQLAQAYNVQEVPLVVVDGKFVTSPSRAGTHAPRPQS